MFNILLRESVPIGGRKQLSQSKPWVERLVSSSFHTDGGRRDGRETGADVAIDQKYKCFYTSCINV